MSAPDLGPNEGSASIESGFWLHRSWWLRAGQASVGVYAATGLSFLATLVAARALQPQGFGALELAVAAVAGLATLLDFSLEEAIVHFGARAVALGDWSAMRRLVRTSLRIDVAIGVVLFVLIVGSAGPFSDFLSRSGLSETLIRLAACEVLAVTANGTTGAVLIVSGLPHLRAWAAAVSSFARLVGVVVAATVDTGASGVLLGLVIGSSVGAVNQAMWAWRVARRGWGPSESRLGDRVAGRRIVAFGFHSSATTTLVAIRAALISVVLGRRLGPSAVGLFAVALFPVSLAEVVTSPLRLVMLPEHARLAARREFDVIRKSVAAYMKAAVTIGVPAVVAGWFALPRLLPLLYGEGYEGSVRPARMLLVAALASLVVAWAKGLPAAIGRPVVRTVMSAIELALTILGLTWLASRGVEGAAAAVATVGAVMVVLWVLVGHRMLRAEATRPVER